LRLGKKNKAEFFVSANTKTSSSFIISLLKTCECGTRHLKIGEYGTRHF
jgi:hypothetical protein